MIKIRHIEGTKYEATNGKEILVIDTTKYAPVELFVTGMGNCSLFDVVALATNKNYEIKNVELDIEYKRKDTHPKVFTEFHLIYKFDTNADNITAKRWVLSSLETYCSTINTVRNTSKIYYSIIVNGDTIAFKESIVSGVVSDIPEFDDEEGIGCSCCEAER